MVSLLVALNRCSLANEKMWMPIIASKSCFCCFFIASLVNWISTIALGFNVKDSKFMETQFNVLYSSMRWRENERRKEIAQMKNISTVCQMLRTIWPRHEIITHLSLANNYGITSTHIQSIQRHMNVCHKTFALSSHFIKILQKDFLLGVKRLVWRMYCVLFCRCFVLLAYINYKR